MKNNNLSDLKYVFIKNKITQKLMDGFWWNFKDMSEKEEMIKFWEWSGPLFGSSASINVIFKHR